MRQCANCGSNVEDNMKFCGTCGTEIKEPEQPKDLDESLFVYCKKCGNRLPATNVFCAKCGATVPKPKVRRTRQEKRRALLKVGIVALVGVAVWGIWHLISNRETSANLAVYVKNENVYIAHGKDEPVKLCDADFSGAQENVSVLYEQKKVIYAEMDGGEPDDEDSTVSLYYKELNDLDGEEVEIADGVERYTLTDIGGMFEEEEWSSLTYRVTDDGAHIIYVADGELCISDLENSTKLGEDVVSCRFNEDASKIVYVTEDGAIYYWDPEDGIEEIADDVYMEDRLFAGGDFFYAATDFSDVYYVNEARELILYCNPGGNTIRGTIAEDISEIRNIKAYDSGHVYYCKTEEVEKPVQDFIKNDLSKIETLEEPKEPEYEEVEDEIGVEWFDSIEEWEEYNEDWVRRADEANEKNAQLEEEYLAAYEKYENSLAMQDMVEELKSTTIYIPEAVYYHYYKSESEEIGRLSYRSAGDYLDYAKNGAAIAFYVTGEYDMPSVNYMNYDCAEDVVYAIEEKIENASYDARSVMIAMGGKLYPQPFIDENNLQFQDCGESVAFIQEATGDTKRTVKRLDMEDGELKEVLVGEEGNILYDSLGFGMYNIEIKAIESISYYPGKNDMLRCNMTRMNEEEDGLVERNWSYFYRPAMEEEKLLALDEIFFGYDYLVKYNFAKKRFFYAQRSDGKYNLYVYRNSGDRTLVEKDIYCNDRYNDYFLGEDGNLYFWKDVDEKADGAVADLYRYDFKETVKVIDDATAFNDYWQYNAMHGIAISQDGIVYYVNEEGDDDYVLYKYEDGETQELESGLDGDEVLAVPEY